MSAKIEECHLIFVIFRFIIIIIIVIPLLHFGAITTYHKCSGGSDKSFGYCCFLFQKLQNFSTLLFMLLSSFGLFPCKLSILANRFIGSSGIPKYAL